MKQLFICFLLISISQIASSQVDSTTPPYKKFPTVPPLQLLLADSTTTFTKDKLSSKKPVLIMLFSPDCSYCQHEAEEFLTRKEELKKIQVVMITFHPLWQMNEFVKKYRLNELSNIVVGKDIYLTMPSFYNIHNLPFHALYDKKGKLITVQEGSLEFAKMMDAFEN
ncbi:MAG TPA: redoxin domain-containing protein [Flavisolibacter sp.]|nr:redoxin domain-containing protein [Flavisolibacter sp.]